MKNKTLAVLMTASMIMSAVIPAVPVFAANKTHQKWLVTGRVGHLAPKHLQSMRTVLIQCPHQTKMKKESGKFPMTT